MRTPVDGLYDRLARDIKAGKPLVVTMYVALCDNDSQGIVKVTPRSICEGDTPEKNIYWGSGGGLKGRLSNARWDRILYEASATGPLAIRGVWTKKLPTGGALKERGVTGSVDAYIVGLGYRGREIRQTVVDYLHAVARDDVLTVDLASGRSLEAGGASHVLGYAGHDYFMDETDVRSLYRESLGDAELQKGVFALSCLSDVYFRPALARQNTHILALNTNLTYPSAFTAEAIVRAVAAGKDLRGIVDDAKRAYATGQHLDPAKVGKIFSGGNTSKSSGAHE